MVSFTCDACGNTVRKNQVEKHYQTKCRNCSVLSCIDCGVDFPGDSYLTHTSCITEAEKYQGNLYQAKDKENKGQVKQKEWLKQLQEATDSVADPRLKSMLEKISEYSNVPRKKKKFENFCKNSVNVYDQKTLDALWDAFIGGTEKTKSAENENNTNAKEENTKTDIDNDQTNCDDNTDQENKKDKKKRKRQLENEDKNKNITKKKKRKKKSSSDEEEEGSDGNSEIKKQTEMENTEKGKFHWHKAIKIALKEADENKLSIKKLKKKVVAAYETHGFDHRASTVEESKALFEKKLKTYPKIKIIKNTVKLI